MRVKVRLKKKVKKKLGNALVIFAVIWAIGTCGGIELDTLTMAQTIIYFQLSIIAFLIGGILNEWSLD